MKEITNKPFGVNIMLMNPEADQIAQVVVDEGVKVVTTGAGNPGKYISAIPPAAITGMLTASTTCGTSVIVVASPIWPPDSMPSATTASAPARSIIFASAALATTGMTLIPACCQRFGSNIADCESGIVINRTG